MTAISIFVNPHPAPDAHRLAQTTDETLRRMIQLRRSEIPNDRLNAAGVPPLNTLVAELLHREHADVGAQR
jgi:hypothetical protein